MKKHSLILALLACGVTGHAMAQAQDYRVTHVSEVGMSALDVGTLQKNSERSVFAGAQVFYPYAQEGYGKSVDFVILMGEYDCTTAGRWRTMGIFGFESGKGDPVGEETNYDAQWEVNASGSLGYANWEGACHGVSTEYRLPFDFTSAEGREQALRYYRDFLKKRR